MKHSKPHVFWCRKHASWVCQTLRTGDAGQTIWVYAFGYSPEASVRYLNLKGMAETSVIEPRKEFGAKP